jgi:hypothetical protein
LKGICSFFFGGNTGHRSRREGHLQRVATFLRRCRPRETRRRATTSVGCQRGSRTPPGRPPPPRRGEAQVTFPILLPGPRFRAVRARWRRVTASVGAHCLPRRRLPPAGRSDVSSKVTEPGPLDGPGPRATRRPRAPGRGRRRHKAARLGLRIAENVPFCETLSLIMQTLFSGHDLPLENSYEFKPISGFRVQKDRTKKRI